MRRLTSIGQPLDMSPNAFGEPRLSNDARDDVPELRRRIAEDGYLFFREFFGREETIGARREVVNWLDGGGMLDRGRPVLEAVAAAHASTRIEPEAGKFPSVRRLMHGGRIMQFYERLLGGTARAYDYIWLRVPSPGQVTGPHCDIIYMGRGTTNLYTSWVPLGDVLLEHGAPLILEGSHRVEKLKTSYGRMDIDRHRNWRKVRFRHWKLFRGGDYSRNPRAVQRQFRLRWLTTNFFVGDLLVFTAYTLHASLDNVSNVIRISADTRYQLASEPIDERWIGDNPIGHSQAE